VKIFSIQAVFLLRRFPEFLRCPCPIGGSTVKGKCGAHSHNKNITAQITMYINNVLNALSLTVMPEFLNLQNFQKNTQMS
jgi:hypothetical protein